MMAYFFENEDGASITVDGDTYHSIIIEFFCTHRYNEDEVNDVWLQQDGVTSHAKIDLLF